MSSKVKTPKGQVSEPPKTETLEAPKQPIVQAVAKWELGSAPNNLPSGTQVLLPGQDTGRKNKLGAPIVSKGLVIKTPGTRSLQEANPGMTAVQAGQAEREIANGITGPLTGRIVAAVSRGYILRRYSETPGKRNRISGTWEQVNVESTVEKLAREYNMSVEEVCKRLNIPHDTAIPV